MFEYFEEFGVCNAIYRVCDPVFFVCKPISLRRETPGVVESVNF